VVQLRMQWLQFQADNKDITTLKEVLIFKQSESGQYRAQLFETLYRLMWLTRRKVVFKTKRTGTTTRIILVPSTQALSKCDLMFLRKKGFKVGTAGCKRDTCFQCNPNLAPIRQAVNARLGTISN
jgi:hypothetical protein